MKLAYLSLKNYRRFKSAEVEFPDGLVGIIGRNGAGKSSLMEAVAWSLYGNEKSIVRTDRESIKHLAAAPSEPCEAVLEFEFEGSTYRVKREMRGKTLAMNATLEIDGKLMANGAREVTEAIQKALGMDYKSFFISVFAQQKELNALTTLRPAERQKEIMRMLGIDDIDDAVKAVRTEARELQSAIKGAQDELFGPDGQPVIELLASELEESSAELKAKEKELASLKRRLGKAEKEHEKLKAGLRETEKVAEKRNRIQKKIASKSATVKGLVSNLKGLRKELEAGAEDEKRFSEAGPKLERAERDLSEIVLKRKEARKERDAILSSITENKAEIRRLKTEISEVRAELKNIEKLGPDSECPTCRRKMDSAYSSLIKIFEGQIKDKKKRITELEKAVERSAGSQAACDARLGALDKREGVLQKRIRDFEVLKTKVEGLGRTKTKVYDLERELAGLEKDLGGLEKDLGGMKFDEDDFKARKEKSDALAGELRRLERDGGELKAAHGRLEAGIAASEKEMKRLEKLESQLSEKVGKAKLLGTLEEVMKDFKQHMISRIRPTLSQSSSALMDQLTGGRYTEIFLDADYDISMTDGGKLHPIDRFSGGEKDLANLCIRLAISQIIAERAGSAGFNFIVLDEIFGSQDSHRRKNIFTLLGGLSNRFKQMFLITHMDEVKDMMGSVIMVVDEDDGTTRLEVL